jgi:hypothetical protein
MENTLEKTSEKLKLDKGQANSSADIGFSGRTVKTMPIFAW